MQYYPAHGFDQLLVLTQVTLAQAVRRGLHSVVAMYEDRHQLWGLGPGGSVVTRSIRCRRIQVASSSPGMIAN